MRSMTGYGQGTWKKKARSITVEVKSVNQRFLEMRVNLPRDYMPWEAELRALMQKHVSRGKVDVFVSSSGAALSEARVEVDLKLARSYVAAWRHLQRALALPGTIDVGMLQGRGDFVRTMETRSDPKTEIAAVRAALKKALAVFVREREREGKVLQADMQARIKRLEGLRKRMAARAGQQLPELARRLRERVETLLQGRDLAEDRLVQEVALLAERADVTEELVRLGSHLEGLSRLLRERSAVGKKMDFLLQEVHREVNTIASKSADLEMTNQTLEARAEIDKLREQAQNVE